MKKNKILFMLLGLTIFTTIAAIAFDYINQYKLKESFSVHNLFIDNHLNEKKFSKTLNSKNNAPFIMQEIAVKLKVKVYAELPSTIFKVGDLKGFELKVSENGGLNLNLDGVTLDNYKSLQIINKVIKDKWYDITIKLGLNKTISVYVDGNNVYEGRNENMEFLLTSLYLGFDGKIGNQFDGSINNFDIDIKYFEKDYIAWADLLTKGLIVSLILLFLLYPKITLNIVCTFIMFLFFSFVFNIFNDTVTVSIEAKKNSLNDFGIYIDYGSGFAQKNFIGYDRSNKNNDTEIFNFKLRNKWMSGIRVDPGNAIGEYIIEKINLYRNKKLVYSIDANSIASQFVPLFQLERYYVKNNLLYINAADGDPQFRTSIYNKNFIQKCNYLQFFSLKKFFLYGVILMLTILFYVNFNLIALKLYSLTAIDKLILNIKKELYMQEDSIKIKNIAGRIKKVLILKANIILRHIVNWFKTANSQIFNMDVFLFSMIASVLAYYFFCKFVLIDKTESLDYIRAYAGSFLPGAYGLSPEKNENIFYRYGVMFVPFVSVLFYSLFSFVKMSKYFKIIYRTSLIAFLILMLKIIFKYSITDMYGAGIFTYEYSIIKYVLVILICSPVLFFIKKFKIPSMFQIIIALFVLAVSSATLYINENMFLNQSFLNNHFKLFLGIVNQVINGKTILVDLYSQYGTIYPYLFEWIFKYASYSIENISIIFVSLIFISYLFIYLFFCEYMGCNSLWPLFCILAVLGLNNQYFIHKSLTKESIESYAYYAYFPIRTLFPMFFSYFALKFIKKETKVKYYLGYFLAALSLLWNMDAGIVVFISWIGLNIYNGLSKKYEDNKILAKIIIKEILVLISSLIIVMGLYSVFTFVRCGSFPNWKILVEYQKIFYESGFYMLGMKLFDLWNIPMIVYLSVIAVSLRLLFNGRVTVDSKSYFYLAVLGYGLFVYYQGRSYIYTLCVVSYPLYMITSCLIYDIVNNKIRFNSKFWSYVVFLSLSVMFFHGLMNFGYKSPSIYKYCSSIFKQNNKIEIDNSINQLIEKNKSSKGTVFIFNNTEYYHYKTKTYSLLPFASTAEIILVDHAKEIEKILDSDKVDSVFVADNLSYCVFLGYYSFKNFRYDYNGADIEKNSFLLWNGMIDKIDNNKKLLSDKILNMHGDFNINGKEIWFNGKDAYAECKSTNIKNFNNKQFSISLWVKFNKSQNSHKSSGYIFSCYENNGLAGYDLYFNNGNSATFSITDGKNVRNASISYWWGITYGITDGRWHHLAVVVDKNNDIIIYQNGYKVNIDYSGSQMKEILSFDKPSIFTIGCNNDKKEMFNGCILDLKYYDKLLTNEEVRYIFHNKFSDPNSKKKVFYIKN